MKFNVISIFPDIFNSYINESIIKRAKQKKLIEINIYNLRDYAEDKHHKVDDTPYGGGAGMLLKIDPLYKALKAVVKKKNKKRKIILLSAGGKQWTQKIANRYSRLDELVLICGRYEGVDARIKKFIDEEVSIGKYVLTGGELPALIIIDSITRLIPGVLGNKESYLDESYSETNLIEYPQYTNPAIFVANKKEYKVPSILLSGNHKLIKEWKEKHQKIKKTT